MTVVFSPYHVGLRDHRVDDGPHRIRALGVIEELEKLGVTVHFVELPAVDDLEREIGRSFELLRRIFKAVTYVRANHSFLLILSGNCMAIHLCPPSREYAGPMRHQCEIRQTPNKGQPLGLPKCI
jgi:arginase